MKNHLIVISVCVFLSAVILQLFYLLQNQTHTLPMYVYDSSNEKQLQTAPTTTPAPITTPPPSPTITLAQPKPAASVPINVHYFQTFNNCGPASLAMMLSHFEMYRTQQELGNQLRPYQVASGDNDDKSTTLQEIADKAEEFGLVAYHRPAGDIALLKQLLNNGFPVLTRTWLSATEDIGHYRVVKGYDDEQEVIVQDDSLQGKDLNFSYADFNVMWEKFGYEYLVLAEPEDAPVVEAILGEMLDTSVAWQQAYQDFEQRLENNPDDIYTRFNLSVAAYYLGEHQESVQHFEMVESQLPFRTLWYQREPLLAYQQLGQYDELLPRIEHILNNGNRAYSELYQIRGEVYLDQGDVETARREFELAVRYNENYQPAREALEQL
ncbi:MAG: C39 family peptidase [Patescibacteria group bacterium]